MSTVRLASQLPGPPCTSGKTRSFQDFDFDFMTPIACKKSVNLMTRFGVIECLTSGSATRL
jgi:hypothetical protein